MRDATGAVQSVVVLGGNSDLAGAVVERLIADGATDVTLAARDTEAAHARRDALLVDRIGVDINVVSYDALDPGAHRRVLEQAAGDHDVDVVVVAFGALGDPFALESPVETTVALTEVNFSAGIAACHAAADTLRSQGHGSLVVFSSVAGHRVRAENAVYGAAKAGLDGFAQALADSLVGSGVHVMIVRPGFVRTKMTEGRPEAPFATTPERVADDVVEGLRRRRRVVWSPAILRFVFAGLRSLPGPLWRRVAGTRDGAGR